MLDIRATILATKNTLRKRLYSRASWTTFHGIRETRDTRRSRNFRTNDSVGGLRKCSTIRRSSVPRCLLIYARARILMHDVAALIADYRAPRVTESRCRLRNTVKCSGTLNTRDEFYVLLSSRGRFPFPIRRFSRTARSRDTETSRLRSRSFYGGWRTSNWRELIRGRERK